MRFLRAYALNIAALLIASIMAGALSINGSWLGYVITAGVLMLLNVTLKPLLKLVSMPIIGLTFGLFVLVINGFLLWLATHLPFTGTFISTNGLGGLILATLIITAANLVTTHRL